MRGLLERAVNEGILTTYYLKGGVAMELRFAGAARATKGMDLGLEGNRAERLKIFEQALAFGFDAFAFRLKSQGLNIPRQSRGDYDVSRSKRLCGVANAAPILFAT
ncbi:MAG: hypothetical protein P4M01_10150 [Acidobacteriota bacterium]|nr:hypothetical protein [Acidobacteriota bacterium]